MAAATPSAQTRRRAGDAPGDGGPEIDATGAGACGVVGRVERGEQLGGRRGPMRRILLEAAQTSLGQRARGIEGVFEAIGAGVSVMCAATSCCGVARRANGWAPVSSSYAITPQA